MNESENRAILARIERWIENRRNIIELCKKTVLELNDLHVKINITKLSGNSVSLLGGILGIVGIALSPVTLGASLGLTISGAVIGGAGGLTSTVGSVIEIRKQKESLAKLSKLLGEDSVELKEIQKQVEVMGESARVSFNPTDKLEAFQYAKIVKYIGWNLVANPIVDGIKLATVAGRTARLGVKAVPLVGNILMLPLDIVFLAHSAIELSEKKIPEICEKINEVIKQLEEFFNQLEKGCNQEEEKVDDSFLARVLYQGIIGSNDGASFGCSDESDSLIKYKL
eukprot:TRINITY_DN5595_c0_g1_i1.p1 TRINITY_DN5595_c0_g1~~TRINITY_DN5595_c0_g1_i1.p1  ORF type:complete len:283 (+),score=55.59 TRINITY_DN5595_c0_g1_i1:99-947(+)